MRTTFNIDDNLLDRAREVAKRSRLSLRETVNRALGLGLGKLDPRTRSRHCRCKTHKMGFPPSLNLDEAVQLAALLEHEETARKLLVRK